MTKAWCIDIDGKRFESSDDKLDIISVRRAAVASRKYRRIVVTGPDGFLEETFVDTRVTERRVGDRRVNPRDETDAKWRRYAERVVEEGG